MRMIDADALRDNLQALAYDDWNQGVTTSWADAYREVADMVEEMPTIEPKTGKWISLDDFRGKYNVYGYKCSECGEHSEYEENYCPNCGADMRGNDHEND